MKLIPLIIVLGKSNLFVMFIKDKLWLLQKSRIQNRGKFRINIFRIFNEVALNRGRSLPGFLIGSIMYRCIFEVMIYEIGSHYIYK
uniref:Uncharacterized protein n=1 Tax=Lepeophtheirus salmonis TaxID=72036 RepID=A0A0K2VFW4_LEPSM